MDDKNELNDIVLNKKSNSKSGKRTILVIAVLAIILIIVISIVNIFSSNAKHNLPIINKISKLPKLPSEGQSNNQLFKPVKVIQERNTTATALDKIAKQLKTQQAMMQQTIIKPKLSKIIVKHKKILHTKIQSIKKKIRKKYEKSHTLSHIKKYIQVGAFVKFKPNKKFLSSIKKHGYNITYKKVRIKNRIFTRVLIGPFANKLEIQKALVVVQKEISLHAYVTNN